MNHIVYLVSEQNIDRSLVEVNHGSDLESHVGMAFIQTIILAI
jgi:hypothetical protein